MLFWKIFAVVDVLLNIGFWQSIVRGTYQTERSDWLYVSINIVGTLGVIAYAFSLPALPPAFWKIIFPIYLASVAWEIATLLRRSDADTGTYIGILLVMLLAGFTAIALYRLGGAAWFGDLGV